MGFESAKLSSTNSRKRERLVEHGYKRGYNTSPDMKKVAFKRLSPTGVGFYLYDKDSNTIGFLEQSDPRLKSIPGYNAYRLSHEQSTGSKSKKTYQQIVKEQIAHESKKAHGSTKGRKGPSDSATAYPVGTRKRGNDGAMWEIKSYPRGNQMVQRWVREDGGINMSYETKKLKGQKSRTHKETKKEFLENFNYDDPTPNEIAKWAEAKYGKDALYMLEDTHEGEDFDEEKVKKAIKILKAKHKQK